MGDSAGFNAMAVESLADSRIVTSAWASASPGFRKDSFDTSPAFSARLDCQGELSASRYTYIKDEAKLKLRDLILVFGRVPRGGIRPTDLAPVIMPEHECFACRAMRWGWLVPWYK